VRVPNPSETSVSGASIPSGEAATINITRVPEERAGCNKNVSFEFRNGT
jgi:hypothetical protein